MRRPPRPGSAEEPRPEPNGLLRACQHIIYQQPVAQYCRGPAFPLANMAAPYASPLHRSPTFPHFSVADVSKLPDVVVDFLQHLESPSTRAVAVDHSLPPPHTRSFVPISALRRYLTPGVIRRLLVYYFRSGKDWKQVHEDYMIVFTILVCINKVPWLHHFLERPRLADKYLPFTHCHDWRPDCHDFFDYFVQAQWQFCAQKLEKNKLNHAPVDERVIVPFVKKRTINEGTDSVKYEVEVHPDYNFLVRDDQDCPVTNTFFLKSCVAENAGYHNNEVVAYQALRDQDDVQPYLAQFHGSWIQGGTYNLLLEYVGGGTLTAFMEGTEIPARQEHIMRFWEGLLNLIIPLMRIHSLPYADDGHPDLRGIHHDIKPDNILVTTKFGPSTFDVMFKLADLGLTDFEYAVKRGVELSSKNNRGTQMFSPPELCVEEDDMFLQKTVLDAKPSKDIWAFGCVLSEAATWLVLGKEALHRYRWERIAATHKVPKLRETSHTGCFHDGTKVLQEVLDTHMKIRERLRRNDKITEKVVDLVEEMLGGASSRPTAVDVRRRSRSALQIAQRLSHLGSTNDDEDDYLYPEIFTTPRSPGFERKEPPQLPPELNGVVPGLGVSFSPNVQVRAAETVKANASTTNKSLTSPTEPIKLEHRVTSPHVSPHPGMISSITINPNGVYKDLPTRTRPAPSAPAAQCDQDQGFIPRDFQNHSPQPSEANGKFNLGHDKTNHTGSLAHEHIPEPQNTPTNPTSPKIKCRPHFPVATIGDVERYILRAKLNSRTAHLDGEDWLKPLNGRDQIFLFDDSGSMKEHWDSAKRTFSALGYIVKGKDPDGMEIRSTMDTSFKKRNKDRGPLRKALSTLQPGGECDIGRTLGQILRDLHPDNAKDTNGHGFFWSKQKWGVNIYVLTDGVWEDGDDWIARVVEPIKKLIDSGMQKGQLGIQFIQFGSDPVGTARLRMLDDHLKDHGVAEDFIDTEPFTGNIFKMLLGSIDDAADRQKPRRLSMPAAKHERHASVLSTTSTTASFKKETYA
ncbi:hypothetical protein BU23DRAFT_553149 [Bimuria novae-zelandiae CBS 107.79]|uniref:Protein kinase domain-containing protein n=1 Tax=Bimuria novae-zelandiae CBS 107.79 TaxID=1447943 RepID=A0A6A5VGB8_9PLEO|nr:hypothetical protein BU23DRAFT_553149 [Bimuria novae-zelandiae CBS 107.79]